MVITFFVLNSDVRLQIKMRENKLIDVYPYTFSKKGEILFLLLQRSPEVIYAGQWRMIGGKVEYNETYWQAALREFSEETALTPCYLWSVPTLNTFYLPQKDAIVHAVPFAAEIEFCQTLTLNHEHCDYEYVGIDEACSKLAWPEQRRILKMVNEIVLTNGILDDWRVF